MPAYPEVTRIKTILLSHNKFCIAEEQKHFVGRLILANFDWSKIGIFDVRS